MSDPALGQPLSLEGVVETLREVMRHAPDHRTGKNCVYSLEDAALAAFGVFFTQSPSFLAYQRTMERAKGRSNAHTLFGVRHIPTDNCIRALLDPVAPHHLFPLFTQIFEALDAAGCVDPFRIALGACARGPGQLLIALDGTTYHHSHTVHCPQCTRIAHRNGDASYQHTVVTPVVVTPGRSDVLALTPEFVVPQDGHDKQDCETAAAKRWLAAWGRYYRPWGVTLLGDDLYSRQPLCEAARAEGFDFLFVCKPASHATLTEWVEGCARAGLLATHRVVWRKGRKVFTDTYRFLSDVPLRDGDYALKVNWFELTTTDGEGRPIYHNAWITSHVITADGVARLAQAGRARWHVENGCNNVMKTKGYHLEHNFGHGKRHLASLLATLNLLAFLLHTMQELTHRKYRRLREALPSRKAFFQSLQALTTFMIFDGFEALFDFMLAGLELDAPDSS